MSNFYFLEQEKEYSLFSSAAIEAERVYSSAPAMCAVGCRKALELAHTFPFVYAAVGIHPSDCGDFEESQMDELEKLARENPGDELYLAIGSDMLLSFDGWHRWEDILRLAHLVVTSRNIGDDPALHAKARQLDASGARILFAPVEALPMASSVLRTRLAAGEECENELPASVRRVIRREGLYTKGDEVTNESETGKRACAQPAE